MTSQGGPARIGAQPSEVTLWPIPAVTSLGAGDTSQVLGTEGGRGGCEMTSETGLARGGPQRERPGSEVIQGGLLSGVWYLKTGGIWILFLWRRGGGGGSLGDFSRQHLAGNGAHLQAVDSAHFSRGSKIAEAGQPRPPGTTTHERSKSNAQGWQGLASLLPVPPKNAGPLCCPTPEHYTHLPIFYPAPTTCQALL